MATVVLNAISSAHPTITNRIRASIYSQSAPLVMVASIIDTTIGHPIRTWSFPGLPRDNYIFSLDEIDSVGAPITNLALFDVVPGEIEGDLIRDDEQIQVDATPGMLSGATSFVFDGTGGKPDYRNWEIVPSELTGRGILVRQAGMDYSWDKATGTFQLLQAGDVFEAGTFYNIHFNSLKAIAGGSVPPVTTPDFIINLVTVNTTLIADDFGTKIIVEPAAPYLEITLPSIGTVIEGKKLYVECTGSDTVKCVRIKQFGTDVINFLKGNIYILPFESLSIYKFTRSAGVDEWRVCECDGNFKHVGEVIGDDMVPNRSPTDRSVINKQLLDGSSLSVTQYARLYNEVVLYMPIVNVVSYTDWLIGNNKYFYSLDNGAGQFRIPDRRGLIERNNDDTGKPGNFQAAQTGQVTVVLPLVQHTVSSPNFGVTDGPLASPSSKSYVMNPGQKSNPDNILINKYVFL